MTDAQNYATFTSAISELITTNADLSHIKDEGNRKSVAQVRDYLNTHPEQKEVVAAYGQHLRETAAKGGKIKSFESFAKEKLPPEQIAEVNEKVFKTFPDMAKHKTAAFKGADEVQVDAIKTEAPAKKTDKAKEEEEGFGSWAKKNGGGLMVGLLALVGGLMSGGGLLMGLLIAVVAFMVASQFPAVQNLFNSGMDAVGLGDKKKEGPAAGPDAPGQALTKEYGTVTLDPKKPQIEFMVDKEGKAINPAEKNRGVQEGDMIIIGEQGASGTLKVTHVSVAGKNGFAKHKDGEKDVIDYNDISAQGLTIPTKEGTIVLQEDAVKTSVTQIAAAGRPFLNAYDSKLASEKAALETKRLEALSTNPDLKLLDTQADKANPNRNFVTLSYHAAVKGIDGQLHEVDMKFRGSVTRDAAGNATITITESLDTTQKDAKWQATGIDGKGFTASLGNTKETDAAKILTSGGTALQSALNRNVFDAEDFQAQAESRKTQYVQALEAALKEGSIAEMYIDGKKATKANEVIDASIAGKEIGFLNRDGKAVVLDEDLKVKLLEPVPPPAPALEQPAPPAPASEQPAPPAPASEQPAPPAPASEQPALPVRVVDPQQEALKAVRSAFANSAINPGDITYEKIEAANTQKDDKLDQAEIKALIQSVAPNIAANEVDTITSAHTNGIPLATGQAGKGR